MKLLFLLHQHLPPDTLSGHTSRFFQQFSKLGKFYNSCRNLQYFKYLVQVPSLPDNPPNFLVASEIHSHVTPVAVVPDVVDDLVDDSASEMGGASNISGPLVEERERYIDQLLAEIESLQGRVTQLEDGKARHEELLRSADERLREERLVQDKLRGEIVSNQAEMAGLTQLLQEAQAVQQSVSERDDKNKSLEEKFRKLKDVYQKLREEHIALLRQKADVDKKLSNADITKADALKSKEIMEKQLAEVLTQVSAMKETAALSENEQSKQIHNLQATNISLTTKLADLENDSRQKEEAALTLEKELQDRDTELAQLKVINSDAGQNKHNLECEVAELTARTRELQQSHQGDAEIIQELKNQLENQTEALAVKVATIKDLTEKRATSDAGRRERSVAVLEAVRRLEDVESLTCSGQTLLDVCSSLRRDVRADQDPVLLSHHAALVWVSCVSLSSLSCPPNSHLSLQIHGRGLANTCPSIDTGAALCHTTDLVMKECRELVETPASSSDGLLTAMDQVELSCREALKSLGQETDLADLVALEISAMDVAIEEAAAKIEELLEASRQKDTGAKLEVNEAVLDSCTGLVKAIRELVKKSKLLQTEIISDRGAGVTDQEYYKKNSRWTEGLISAAKAVGLGAKLLVDAADRFEMIFNRAISNHHHHHGRVVMGSGKFEEIMVASQDVAASTAQLVIASRVKVRQSVSQSVRVSSLFCSGSGRLQQVPGAETRLQAGDGGHRGGGGCGQVQLSHG